VQPFAGRCASFASAFSDRCTVTLAHSRHSRGGSEVVSANC
jgi:hypothetical protein